VEALRILVQRLGSDPSIERICLLCLRRGLPLAERRKREKRGTAMGTKPRRIENQDRDSELVGELRFVILPEPTYSALEQAAIRKGLTMAELLRRALELALKE
jgi:hypothetical protein